MTVAAQVPASASTVIFDGQLVKMILGSRWTLAPEVGRWGFCLGKILLIAGLAARVLTAPGISSALLLEMFWACN